MPTLREFKDRDACADALAATLAEQLRAGIAENGRATLVLSGGSSPIGLFERLALIELDWSRVTVLPSDERWVPVTDPESNERLLREQLHRALQAARLLWTTVSEHPSDFGKISLGTWHDSHRDPRGFDETW